MAAPVSSPFVAEVAGERIIVPYGFFGGMYRATPSDERAVAACFLNWCFFIIVPLFVQRGATALFGPALGWGLTAVALIGVIGLWSIMVAPHVRTMERIPGRPPWLAIIAAQTRERSWATVLAVPVAGVAIIAVAVLDATTWHVVGTSGRALFAAVGVFFAAYGVLTVWLRLAPRPAADHRELR